MAPLRYEDRTDSVSVKLAMLQQAYAAGNLDLARSLTDSLKATLAFSQQLEPAGLAFDVAVEHFRPVASLPNAWARWCSGWELVAPITVFETVGMARQAEPVEITLACSADQTADLFRELRVARVNQETGELVEIVSQVHSEGRSKAQRHAQLIFQVDVDAHQQADFLVLCGNPHAERPEYVTDLRTAGEGYGLDIENHYYQARLSRQMGQLERLTSKRQHGLELYAGGKGHGEPPGIDWAHDYVDEGNFQKLRMRNWAECSNYEVIRGPLCVSVRRWGFPHSPVHPVFTPSRVHMDQTYRFYAGLPYFMKEGRIDAVRDLTIQAMRDDEWVFSGYSFTDMLWIDQQGRLHEGAVPPEHTHDLWGVGFYHRTSRDAFIALWLDHSGQQITPRHGGAPTLHYDGHGQLWSRYPAEQTQLAAGTSIRQRNAYWFAEFPNQEAATQVEQLRHGLVNPLVLRAGELPTAQAAASSGALARAGETSRTAAAKTAIWQALREVRDEQLYSVDANIVDMGYVSDIRIRDQSVHVLVTMPHRGRPVHEFLVTAGGGRVSEGIHERLMRLPGVRNVVVDATWDPPWTIARLTDRGRRALGLDQVS